MANFRDLDDVRRWVEEREDGLSALRQSYASGAFSGYSKLMVGRYLTAIEDEASRAGILEERRLLERSTVAAEQSARAATDSARSARKSARWSRWAVLVALAALFVAAWPHMCSSSVI